MRARSVHRALIRPVLVFAALFTPAVAAADTIIVGGNVINQTWTAAGSPYVVQGDVTVPVGSTLRIQPGAQVRFADSDDQGAGVDPRLVELTVNGTLRVEGSHGAPVRLEGASASTRSWYGVIVSGSAAASFHDFELRHATIALAHHGAREAIAVARGFIEMSGTGIQVFGALDADRLEIRGTAYDEGVVVGWGATASLSNCVLRGLSYGVRNDGTVIVDHCTITGNDNAGVWSGTSDATATIRSSIVTGQRNHGVIASFPSIRTSVVHSNVWGNGVDYLNASPGAGTISANPLYVSATDLRLQPSSVCIDTAAAGAIDHDILGTARPIDGDGIGAIASDMGAYEYVPPGTPAPDAGVLDAATPDAAIPDAATPDAATPDAATPDAGVDAGVPDAGVDAGMPDAATPGPDAGAPDAGTEPPAEGSCSAGGGGAGGLLIALAALAAERRRRRAA
jgi:hypothetical protein